MDNYLNIIERVKNEDDVNLPYKVNSPKLIIAYFTKRLFDLEEENKLLLKELDYYKKKDVERYYKGGNF